LNNAPFALRASFELRPQHLARKILNHAGLSVGSVIDECVKLVSVRGGSSFTVLPMDSVESRSSRKLSYPASASSCRSICWRAVAKIR
jgi:hypothetical protein